MDDSSDRPVIIIWVTSDPVNEDLHIEERCVFEIQTKYLKLS